MKKGNLIFSIVSLIVSVLLCGGVLLAWFSLNQKVGAGGLDVNISSGQLATIDSIIVEKQTSGSDEWLLAAEYNGENDQWTTNETLTGGNINGILEGDVHKFTVTLERTPLAEGKTLSVSALFSGITVAHSANSATFAEGQGYDDLKRFFLVSNDNENYSNDRSFYTADDKVTLAEGQEWADDGTELTDTFTFVFYIKFHNVATDDDWAGTTIPTINFKGCSVKVDVLSISVSAEVGGGGE